MRKTQVKKIESSAKRESTSGSTENTAGIPVRAHGKPGRPSLAEKRKSTVEGSKAKSRKSVTIQSPQQEAKRRSTRASMRVPENPNDSGILYSVFINCDIW